MRKIINFIKNIFKRKKTMATQTEQPKVVLTLEQKVAKIEEQLIIIKEAIASVNSIKILKAIDTDFDNVLTPEQKSAVLSILVEHLKTDFEAVIDTKITDLNTTIDNAFEVIDGVND